MDEIAETLVDNPGVPTIVILMIGREVFVAATLAMLVF